jgi:hypothetical protein
MNSQEPQLFITILFMSLYLSLILTNQKYQQAIYGHHL